MRSLLTLSNFAYGIVVVVLLCNDESLQVKRVNAVGGIRLVGHRGGTETQVCQTATMRSCDVVQESPFTMGAMVNFVTSTLC